MNNIFKYAMIVFLSNVVVYVIFIMITTAFGDDLDVALTLLLFVPIIVLLAELIFGIVFAAGQTKKDLGKGLLIGCGVTILIGLSICGIFVG